MDVFAARRDQARRPLRKLGVDALLVTDERNVTYLTGFTGDSSYLLLSAGGQHDRMVTDTRYATQLGEECPDLELAVRDSRHKMTEFTGAVLARLCVRRLAIEAASMTVEAAAELRERLPKVDFRPTTHIVERLRMVKDKQEVEQIRQAVGYAERALAIVRASLSPEQTERDVANDLEYQMRRLGARGAAFPSIVAVGPAAALPHYQPGERRVGEADFLLVDWGARGRLYCSDLTRLLVTGTIPPKLRKIYTVVLRAQRAGIRAVRPGALASHVDAAARNVIEAAGLGRRFGHGAGHGIGLDVHECPRLAKVCDEPLRPGMVVTIEPGVYVPGWGGVRIEDDVLVTRDGREVLSQLPTELDESLAGCVAP